MFTFYKNIPGLTIHSSAKLGYEFDFIMELLGQFNIIEILRFFKNIEYHFNIPLFNSIITSNVYINILTNPNENHNKLILIIKFLKLFKKYFLIDNAISLMKRISVHTTPFVQKIKEKMMLNNTSFKPLVLGQVYGRYNGSVIPFYIHTSSWYIRTGLLSDVS